MNVKKIISFLLVLNSFLVVGQVPGYMGKRFGLSYSNYFSPALLGSTANSTDFGMNFTHSLNLEYTLGNHTNICGAVQFFKAGIYDDQGYYYYNNSPNGSDNDNLYYMAKSKKPLQLSTTNISLGFKFFKSGFIAPIGRYQKLEFILHFDEVSYDRNSFFESRTRNSPSHSIGTGAYQYKSFSIGYTIGRQRILYKIITLDTGIRFGLTTNGIFTFLADDFLDILDNTNRSTQFTTSLKHDANYRILGSQFINFHIGIGILPF